jgi:hypothetical protein
MKRSALFSVILAGSVLLAAGCTKEDSGEDAGGDGNSGNPGSSNVTLDEFRTSCGTVFKGRLENPVSADDARRGTVRVVGPNLIAMKNKRGEELIKLHGIDVPFSSEKRSQAEALLESLSGEGEVYFYPAEPDCTVTLEDGTEGIVGHVFSAKGKSFAETLLKRGFGETSTDVCGGTLVSSCYRALEEEGQPTPTPTPEPEFEGPSTPAGFILWKPVSDSDGRLAVHSVPFGTSVIVEGERGRNFGPGNGYGSLARFRKSGCGYGRNVRIKLISSNGTAFVFKNGEDSAVIPDGCQRWVVGTDGKAKPNKK